MRTQIELSNEVAAELAGSQDAVLRALEAHLDCKVFLRGNLLTFDGEASETDAGERVVRELADLIARGAMLLGQCRRHANALEQRLMAGLLPREQLTVRRWLSKIAADLQQDAGSSG